MCLQVSEITDRAEKILESIPPKVTLVAASKGRSIAQVEAVIRAGITHIGHNYVQEALPMIDAIPDQVTWHMIGHLQRNKVKKVIGHFDMLETVDSLPLAQTIDRRCAMVDKVMPVLVEVNSGRESNKTGILPEKVDEFVDEISKFQNIHVQGLMTMGPRFGDPEEARPYFKATREAFERIYRMNLPNTSMQ